MVEERAKFLRVGGRLDYKSSVDHFPADQHNDGHIPVHESFDLEEAVRAEVVLELVQSHEDTKGLALQINGNQWIEVPPLRRIKAPQSDYMFHGYPVVPIPLSHLNAGDRNTFKMKVDSTQRWNWPQNIFYAVIFRIYYSHKKADIQEHITGLETNQQLLSEQPLSLQVADSSRIQQVDYIGLYKDFNWEGDGVYRQWHHHSHRGAIRNHIGTSRKAPYYLSWSTSWLPDQQEEIQVAARVVYNDGLKRITPAVEGLYLERAYSVELSQPYRQPPNWVTRADSLTSYFAVHGELARAEALQLAWRSWSPCYARGVFVNGIQVYDREDPCYDYAEHLVTIDNPDFLLQGENAISTGKTPLIDGKMVHGMEVQWPGIMAKVKYENRSPQGVRIVEGTYENRPHYIIITPSGTYYYDAAGGGLSRMIDNEGNDWIAYGSTPWNEYPASAASAYRGIPNSVFQSDDGGAGHPGHDQCESQIVGPATIRSTSKSGRWAWEWHFFKDFAELQFKRIDPDHPYWFLYEGTPGGMFDPSNSYFGTDTGGPRTEQLDYYKGASVFEQWQWAYFGHQDVNRVLFVKQDEPDALVDTFGYLGSTEAGIDSPDGMVVFGFGREAGAKPLLQKRLSFKVGFWEQGIKDDSAHEDIREFLEGL